MTVNLLTQLFDTCDMYPDKVAIIQGKTRYTYAQLMENILAIGANLHAEGLSQGDRVLFSVRPNPEGIMLALGIVSVGGVTVFADPGTATDLFNARMKLAAPKYAAAESLLYFASLPKVAQVASKRGLNLPDYSSMSVRHFYSGHRLPGVPKDAKSIASLMKKPVRVAPFGNPDGEAIIVFTSGTTDDPKAVVHSRTSLGAGMPGFIERCGLDTESFVYTDHFMFGIAAMVAGGTWEIPKHPPAKNAKKWVDSLYSRTVTHSFLVPADTTLMLNEIEKQKKSSPPHLGTLAMGAAPVLPPLIKRVNKVMPDTKVLSVYGMTEILPIATVDGEKKLDYSTGDIAGHPIDTVSVRIDNPDTSGAGEVVLRGDGLMLGYLGKERLEEHYTGDIGRLDDDGQLVLLGRKKDMLIRGNKNIYPGLYESAISSVKGIESATIVGVPDAYGEDIVILVLVPKLISEPAKETISRVKKILPQVLDHDAYPDTIIAIESIPLSGRSSKPDRIKLREEMSQKPSVIKILEERNHG